MKKIHFILFLIIGYALGLQAAVTVRYVDPNCPTPVHPFTSWATASTNIQLAVNDAIPGDLVLVTNGIYQTGGQNSARVDVFKPLTIQSVNGPDVTIIKGYQVPGTTNGTGAIRCVHLYNYAILSGFTLTGGATTTADPLGGGAKCDSTLAVLTNCLVAGNAAGNSGGGSYYGTLVNCVVRDNVAANNSVGNGGGVADSILTNCLVLHNYAGYTGGGALNSTLVNCTVVSNLDNSYAPGVSFSTVKNSILYYNSENGTNAASGSGNFTNCCIYPAVAGMYNCITNPPLFYDLASGNYHLQPYSPCLNAGSNAFILNATDLDGYPRIAASAVDLGAYEFSAPVRFVSASNTTPVSPFLTWTNAATNIQDAIDAASAGDFIVVSNGTYKTGGRIVYGASSNRVVVDKAVTVQSLSGADATLIVGQGSTIAPTSMRCVYLTNGATLIGFTLTNGATVSAGDISKERSGGGVWCEGSSAVVSNCFFPKNAAAQYGGAAFQGTLYNCVLSNNIASRGGGAASNTLINCTLVTNFASFQNPDSGGGAFACNLNGCRLTWNHCFGGGGGAYGGVLNNCSLSNNLANYGGGVCLGTANNSLIVSNRASNYGGGAYSNVLNNCVLKSNLASQFGGGAYRGSLVNCTVVSNTASASNGGVDGGNSTNCIYYYNFAGKNPNFPDDTAMNYCCTFPLATNGLGNITNEPAFINLAGGDFNLTTNSPCLNAGLNSAIASATDFSGNPRVAGGTVDIGAYEFQSPASILSFAWAQQYGLPTDGSADFVDSDGDGLSNWQEWRCHTSPTDAGDVMKLISTGASASAAGATVTWNSASGVNYTLQRSTNLPVFIDLQTSIAGQSGTTSFTDTTATNAGPYFYRLSVQ